MKDCEIKCKEEARLRKGERKKRKGLDNSFDPLRSKRTKGELIKKEKRKGKKEVFSKCPKFAM